MEKRKKKIKKREVIKNFKDIQFLKNNNNKLTLFAVHLQVELP